MTKPSDVSRAGFTVAIVGCLIAFAIGFADTDLTAPIAITALLFGGILILLAAIRGIQNGLRRD